MRIGNTIPDFRAETTQGAIHFHKWQEKSWVVLFSHDDNAAPLSPPGRNNIAIHFPDFEKRGVRLIALSGKELKAPEKADTALPPYFPYPVICDDTRELAIKLGMIDEDQRSEPDTARTLYIIGPDHKLKLSLQYQAATERDVNEILLLVDSLRFVERLPTVVDPVRWPGAARHVCTCELDGSRKPRDDSFESRLRCRCRQPERGTSRTLFHFYSQKLIHYDKFWV